MSTEVIYTRVPSEIKDAVGAHASAHQTSITAAVAELLRLGVESAANRRAVEATTSRVDDLEDRLRREQEKRAQVEQRLALLEQSAATWAKRAEQGVGKCPKCPKVISGYDLLVTGECSACRATISLLMPEKEQRRLDEKQLLVLLGAVAVVLGIAAGGRK